MQRKLTSSTSLYNLKREAKRWLKALRGGDNAAAERLRTAWPGAPAEPGLRDIQQALAREYGFGGWAKLKEALADRALAAMSAEELAAIMLRGAWDDGDRAAACEQDRKAEGAQPAHAHGAAPSDSGRPPRFQFSSITGV